MSVPCRIDSPIPSVQLPWASETWPVFCAEDREEGASTPRASTRHSSPALGLPMLRLPVCHGTPPRSHLAHCLGTTLAQHLKPVSPARYETQVSWDALDALLADIWHGVSPQLPQHKVCRARLLRPDEDAAPFLHLLAHSTDASELTADDVTWLIRSRLRQQHYTIVVEHDGLLVGTAAMLLEQKIASVHELIAHLDDIYVLPAWQTLRLGESLIGTLAALGDKLGVCNYAIPYDWRRPCDAQR